MVTDVFWGREKIGYKSKLKGSSYDTEMTFILERVYSISTYFSVFVNIMGKLHSKSNIIPHMRCTIRGWLAALNVIRT